MPRIVTYNVHRCVGNDRRLNVSRIADVLARLEPDIVALQELDVGRARTGGEELCGDAILTALPERLVQVGPLPGHPLMARLEPRGALWVQAEVGGRCV